MVDCFGKPRAGTVVREVIASRTLDSLIDSVSDDEYIGLMKIDIEGYEYYMFQGGQEFFRRFQVPYMLIEYEPIFMTRLNYSQEEHIKLIQRTGYDLRIGSFEGPIVKDFKDLSTNYQRG